MRKPKVRAGSIYEKLLLLLVIFLLNGCQANLLTSGRGTVPEADQITLVDNKEHVGTWQTRDLTIRYRYFRNQNQLEISGDIQFGDYLRQGFRNIVYFNSKLLLVNDQGKVLETRGLATTNYYADSEYLVPFKVTLNLPAGTTAMAFTYTGKARSIDSGDGGFGTDFWYSP